MKVLVDYDNVGDSLRRGKLVDLADKILDRIPKQHLLDATNVNFRLYGGWDKGGNLTMSAQRLAAQLRSSFPKIWNLPNPIKVAMDLAQATEAFPQKPLSNTFRSESVRTISFLQPTKTTCRNSSCPIEPLYEFFRDKQCPVNQCSATPENLGSHETQKMVDTMMVADLIYLASKGAKSICLVSSDDDLWPGILGALGSGSSLIHIQPRHNGYSASRYIPQSVRTYEGVAL